MARRAAIGARVAISAARSFAIWRKCFFSATTLTNPYSRACPASMWRPLSTISIARCLPTIRVSRWVAPPPGISPSVISGSPNCAVFEATIRSQTRASSKPLPSAQPETAATIGDSIAASRSQKLRRFRAGSELGGAERAQVRAGCEDLVAADQQQAARGGIGIELLEPGDDAGEQLGGEGVAGLGALDPADPDRAVQPRYDCARHRL